MAYEPNQTAIFFQTTKNLYDRRDPYESSSEPFFSEAISVIESVAEGEEVYGLVGPIARRCRTGTQYH